MKWHECELVTYGVLKMFLIRKGSVFYRIFKIVFFELRKTLKNCVGVRLASEEAMSYLFSNTNKKNRFLQNEIGSDFS